MPSNSNEDNSPSDNAVLKTEYRGASKPVVPVNFDVPSGTCDCLTHIFGDPSRYPMAPERPYTPELASLSELRAVHQALRVDRVVLVQTTVYGTDNSCMLDSLSQLGERARGIAVIDHDLSQSALDDFHAAGVRGIRTNLETVGIFDPDVARRRFISAVEQLRDRKGWHIQIFTRLSVIEALHDLVDQSPVPVCFDHFAGTPAQGGMAENGFASVCDLLRSNKIYVKVSAPELVSKQRPDYPDVLPLAKALIATNRNRILWASHWPHPDSGREGVRRPATDVTPLRQIDDGYVFNLMPLWAPDPDDLHAILVENPARLYGFEGSV